VNVHLIKSHAEAQTRLREAIARAHDMEADDEAIVDTADGETNILETFDAAAQEIHVLETLVDSIKTRRETLAERESRIRACIDNLRTVLAQSMIDTGHTKALRLTEATLSARMLPPKWSIDPDALPDEYKKDKITRVPDRERIDSVLDIGESIPGVTKTNGKPSLTVRIK